MVQTNVSNVMKRKTRFADFLRILITTASLVLLPYPTVGVSAQTLHYLALGDSYTSGEGAKPAESWPALLAAHLTESGRRVELTNPARTGFTSADLIEHELRRLDDRPVDFVTLLIGANDWVAEVDPAKFQKNFSLILDRVQRKLANPKNVIVLTIPDFGVTRKGAEYAGGRDIGAGIALLNGIILEEARRRGLATVDLVPLSRTMATDATLVAPDGLHPSAKQYAAWEREIFPVVLSVLGDRPGS